ncbi:MAG: alpha/beta fold hydrolase [Novosphingobium sp.]
MARIDIDGIGIAYDLIGPAGGVPVAITPGGRFSRQAKGIRELAEALAECGMRALIWDRPNCGESDLCFEGESESHMQAQALIGLIRALDLGPTMLVAGSAGARVSLFAAAIGGAAISRMFLFWISGGLLSMTRLGSYYCCEPADEASLKGMEAVAAMPIWAEQMAANPQGRAVMTGFAPQDFIAVMERWVAAYLPQPGTPIGGLSPEMFASMAMPVRILRGSPRDLYHPARVGEDIAAMLPNATMADPPWDLDLFDHRLRDNTGLFRDWPDIAPLVDQFVKETRHAG